MARRKRVSDELLDRMPPNNPKIEAELLASILLVPVAGKLIFSRLEAADFYNEGFVLVFDCLARAWKGGMPFGTDGTWEQWRKDDKLDERLKKALHHDYFWVMAGVLEHEPRLAYVGYYCETLRKLRCQRMAISFSRDILCGAWDLQPAEWVERTEQAIVKYKVFLNKEPTNG